MSSLAEKADEPTVDIAEKAEDPDIGTNQAKAQQMQQRRQKTQIQARTRQKHSKRSREGKRPGHRQKKRTKRGTGTADTVTEIRFLVVLNLLVFYQQ